jgi:hypothetical protein
LKSSAFLEAPRIGYVGLALVQLEEVVVEDVVVEVADEVEEEPVPAKTLTVPCIQGWNEQWYVYVPGVVKVNWKVPPWVVSGPVIPESNWTLSPVSEVTV